MRATIALVLLLMCGCTKDTILLEQITIESKAITEFANPCNSLHAQLRSDLDIIVYSNNYSLYSADDFQTLSYEQSSYELITCGTEVVFFDGATSWVRQPVPYSVQMERYSFDGKAYLTLQGDYADFTFSPPVSFSDTKTPLPYFFDDNRTMVGTRASGAPGISIYETNIALKTATLVATTHTLPTTFIPMSIHRAGNTWLLIGHDYVDARDYQVVTSSDLATWQGPFIMAELPSYDFWIDQTSGAGDVMVARAVNQNFTTNQYNPPGTINHLYLVSTDEGHTWGPLTSSMDILFAQVLGDGTIYSVVRQDSGDRGTISKLAKSNDAGVTWIMESPLFYGDRIMFQDASNGLATAQATLQVTHDGGKSWQLLLTSPY